MPTPWQLVASSGFARVTFEPEQGLYYKEFLPRSPWESAKALVRGSRCKRARRQNEVLRKWGFDAPENVAWGKLPGGREYLFSTAVAGQSISWWLQERLAQRSADDLRLRRELLSSLGVFIGRLHAAGFIHGDLRTSNVLAELRDDRFRFALIDNERNFQRQPPPGRALLRNLMQLNMLVPAELSGTERMRFFHHWQRQMRDLSRAEAKLLGREAYLWAMKRLYNKGKL